jgi:hypothetical protein
VKSRVGGISFNGAVFYTDIKDLQTTLDAGSCSSRVVFNVPKAHTKGIEGELTMRLAHGLDIGVSGSLLEAEFDSTVKDGTGAVLGGIREGNRLPSVPKFQISADATYSWSLNDRMEAYVRASVQHVGSRYTQASDQENNPRSFVSGLPFGGATGNVPTDRRPEAAQLRGGQFQHRRGDGERRRPDRLPQQRLRRERPAVVRPRARRTVRRVSATRVGQPRTLALASASGRDGDRKSF